MSAPTADPTSVQAQIEALRRKLLDLSLRNRMLNYRPSKRLGLTVLGEDSEQVHRILVEEGRKMSFFGRPDPAPKDRAASATLDFGDEISLAQLREAAEDELNAFLGNAAMPADQMDTRLQTEEYESVLQAKLRAIARDAHLASEELGINTLFLTLGALEWSENGERTFRAPLLYVPVTLERLANGSMRLLHDGSDVGDNLPLRAKLAEFNLKLPEYDDERPLYTYFDEVSATVRGRAAWTVHRDAICLGFFNYEKYAMYVDLGGELWPPNRKPWLAPDIVRMFGGGYEPVDSSIGDETFLDDVRPVPECHEVFDADSSQTLAMIRAAERLSIVVEGPPGTGKSQTIANIIAEAVADGRTVLFVSAKRAALDVVKRRLEEAELGDICLDLHDKLTNRREFYAEIKRTVGRTLSIREEEARVARLAELRDRLNGHSHAMNEPLDAFGLTPFVAMAELARLPAETPEDREGRVPFEALRGRTYLEIQQMAPAVAALQVRVRATGVPKAHPFWGAEIAYLDPGKRLDLEEEMREAIDCLCVAQERVAEAAGALRIDPPGSAAELSVLTRSARRALEAPPHEGVAVSADRWKAEEGAIRETSATLRRRHELRTRNAAVALESLWSADLDEARRALEEGAERWYRFALGPVRQARRALAPHVRPEAKLSDVERRNLLRDAAEVREAERDLEGRASAMAALFGVQWQGLESDPDVLEGLLQWVRGLQEDVEKGELPLGLLDFLNGAHADAAHLARAEEAERAGFAALEAWRRVARLLEVSGEAADRTPLDALLARVRSWREHLPRLPEMIALNEARRALRERGGEAVVALADAWPLAGERLEDAFRRSYLTGVVREAMSQRPELRAFERAGHEAAIAEFQSLDDFNLKYNRARVRLAHHRRLPTFATAVGNLQLLKVQCELQRRHKPIRWAMARAGEAIQRIKPVFMMSPLSVAIHLPPELPPFDMVIFDEASQVRPEDALSAIVRGRQTIVVGDTRQMPPTSFFDRVADDEEYDEELSEAEELGQEARKLESILSLMSAVTLGHARRPDLRWHYRSVHPALIQPSNEMFYENRLIVFPAADAAPSGRRIGLAFHHLPDGVYEPGARRRINRKEAERVAEAVLAHVRAHPGESLMVAAMNKTQADLIYDEVLRRERQDPEAFARFRARHPHEPLVVKNLENVQGDERDVVFISVTYGRDEHGVLRQQFGPLLRDGGERRLNVLISRARRRCEVFTSLRADDLNVDPSRVGVFALRRYLQFAETGSLEVFTPTGREAESPFEEEVGEALRARGYAVDPQVGTEGYRIDLGVRDPSTPGRYVLGIECDGATYHRARSARDRDKIRQRVLESRGWRLHRIWSHDWWQDRDGEIERLVRVLEEARNPGPIAESEPAPEEADEVFVEEGEREEAPPPIAPYRQTPPPGPIATEEDLLDYLDRVVQSEGPIHHELLFARLKGAAGVGRAGRNVRGYLDRLIGEAVAAGRIRHLVDAYYASDTQLTSPRDWSDRPPGEKKSDLVTEAELAAVLKLLVRSSFGVNRETAVREVYRLVGFRRVTPEATARGLRVVERMLEAGGLIEREGVLRVPREG
jgi:very-short-patch-repair endonuclease